MGLETSLATRLEDPSLTLEQRAQIRCEVSKSLEDSGRYVEAAVALGDLWGGVGVRPDVTSYTQPTAGEILLRVGTLTSWLGESRQVKGAQESAKDFVSESKRIFEQLRDKVKAAEAATELGLCYWRLGEYETALLVLSEAIEALDDTTPALKAVAVLRKAIVEATTENYAAALATLNSAADHFDRVESHDLRGRFYVNRATFRMNLGTPQTLADDTDAALIDYAAAAFHFEEAGHNTFLASVENQLGFLNYTRGRYKEAHFHLRRAHSLFVGLKDQTRAAQVDETEARTFIAEGKFLDAQESGRSAVSVLSKGDNAGLRAEALCTLATAEARGGRPDSAKANFISAAEAAFTAGESTASAAALITLLEELRGHLSGEEESEAYALADQRLPHDSSTELTSRLRRVAATIIESKKGVRTDAAPSTDAETFGLPASTQINWEGFSLPVHLKRVEEEFIRRALEDTGGKVTPASRLLGYKRHHSLGDRINRRSNLQGTRTPASGRRKSLIKRGRTG